MLLSRMPLAEYTDSSQGAPLIQGLPTVGGEIRSAGEVRSRTFSLILELTSETNGIL